ncbi:MAG: serine-type D-Ala-D-Ala carboxypeptidase [Gammaproteobacteria bacterium]|nr:MAG: serine-type D-Ala-D-Ala carboxypeptidase [Gammaproteobacteria bacterium]
MIKKTLVLLIGQLLFNCIVYAGATAIPAPPGIKANSYLLQDFDSGKILASKNIDLRMPPASLTKMMTVHVVSAELLAGRISQDDEVLISEKAWKMPGSRMFIEVNKKVLLGDLLQGVIIQSGNDASVALAEYISGSEEVFAELMNQYASDMGMTNSHFINSTGLPDEQHYTTAKDMAILAAALIRDAPEIYALHSVKEFTFNNITQQNRNKLLWRDPSVDGIKTGHTEAAGYCLVASAKRDDMRLISVVMGTDSDAARAKASQSLLAYGFRFFETQKVYAANENITSVKVWKGDIEELGLGLNYDLYITFPRGQENQLTTEFDLSDQYIAPLNKGDVQGNLKISLANDEVAEAKLIALQSVNEGSIIVRMKDSLRLLLE